MIYYLNKDGDDNMEEIEAKTILSKKDKDAGKCWFGTMYNMNLYRGCSHGCIYCDSRSDCYKIDNFDQVKPKKDVLLILGRELASKCEKGVIGIGSMSDSYNPLEKSLEITRGALKLIYKYGFGISLETKSSLIERDIDILKKINENSDVIIKFTITCANDLLASKIEPYTNVSSERFATLKKISAVGICTGVLLMPILPYINDTEDNIKEIVRLAYENGAKFIYPYFGVTLRDNQRGYFYEKLDSLFPELKKKYIVEYGLTYDCKSRYYKNLSKVFIEECNKYGLLYEMGDIIKLYQTNKNSVEQMTLF